MSGTADILVGRRDSLTRPIVASGIVHALLLLAFSIYSSRAPTIDLNQKPIAAKLVRLGKARDEHLLPRQPEQPPPGPTTVEVPVAPTGPKMAPASAAKASPQSSAASRSRLFDAFAKVSKQAEELPGDPNGDPNGDSDTASEGERYFALIRSKAKQHYSVTKTIAPRDLVRLKAVVVMYIDSNGRLLKLELSEPSGNERFDSDVKAALSKAAPFPPPPAHLRRALETTGIAVECRP